MTKMDLAEVHSKIQVKRVLKPFLILTPLSEKRFPLPLVLIVRVLLWDYIFRGARMKQWSCKFMIRKTCQDEKEVGEKRRKLDSSMLVLLEKQKVDVGHTDRHTQKKGRKGCSGQMFMSTSRQLLPASLSLC